MFRFDPAAYGPGFAPLLAVDRNRELGTGTPQAAARKALAQLDLAAAFGHAELRDREMGELCLAGLWLLYDFLDESHTISQRIKSRTGSYWHAIMHRREGDFSNAKYWFNRVGGHPIYDPLAESAQQLAAGQDLDPPAQFVTQCDWDPFAFVDLCQAVTRGQSTSETLCRQIAQQEWELLFDDCYRRAVGK